MSLLIACWGAWIFLCFREELARWVLFTEISLLLINSKKIDFPPPYEFLVQILKSFCCLLGIISNFKLLSSCLVQQHPKCGAVSEMCSLMTRCSAELLIPPCQFSVLQDKSEKGQMCAECVKSVWRSKREERLRYEVLYFLSEFKSFKVHNTKNMVILYTVEWKKTNQPQILIVTGMLNIVPKRPEPDEYFKPWSLGNSPKVLLCSQGKGEQS